MTLTQAKNLAGDLIDAGCIVTIREPSLGSGDWIVLASRPNNAPTAAQVATFASNRGVQATIQEARFF